MELRQISVNDIPDNTHSLFQSRAYLALFSRSFSKAENLLIIGAYEAGHLVAVLPFERVDSSLIFLGMQKVLGGQEITDYGDVLTLSSFDDKTVWDEVFAVARKLLVTSIVLDYVREDCQTYTYLAHSHNTLISQQEVAPFILLPSTWESYLENLDRVNRKELKRKLKRLDSVQTSFTVYPASSKQAFHDFVSLHRKSSNDKNQFMSGQMEQFFIALSQIIIPSWNSSIALLTIEEKPAAAVFFFENATTTYLYNSGFDPSFKFYSAGLMLHALLIKRGIEAQKKIHDFLRGTERYKYDLGAHNMNLYKITISL